MSVDETLYTNVIDALQDLDYHVRQAINGIRRDTPMWKVQEHLDSISFRADELRKGRFQ